MHHEAIKSVLHTSNFKNSHPSLSKHVSVIFYHIIKCLCRLSDIILYLSLLFVIYSLLGIFTLMLKAFLIVVILVAFIAIYSILMLLSFTSCFAMISQPGKLLINMLLKLFFQIISFSI